MTPQKSLDLVGNFQEHPFAELLVEITQARISGSLRLTNKNQKSIIYFNAGQVVYGVSNLGAHRLFNIILRNKKLDKAALTQFPNFANDIELAASLQAKQLISREDLNSMTIEQIESIIVDALTWENGDWVFSPLARLRSDLIYYTDVHKVLIDYARCLPLQSLFNRFKSVQESFLLAQKGNAHLSLLAHESYVLERFSEKAMKIEELRELSSLPEQGLLQALYVLWLGGLVVRLNWNAAFSLGKITEIQTARISLVKNAQTVNVSVADEKTETQSAEPEIIVPEPEKEKTKLPEIKITLVEYLTRAEKAETHYDVLGISEKAQITEIKNAYFGLAKLFHPDRYHRESETVLRKIQVAFTGIAQAYETLKNEDSRNAYDYKIRKELDAREARRAAGQPDQQNEKRDIQAEQGLESFEQGLLMLNEEEYSLAATYLARAVHYSPQNALYHAYYGHALSADGNQNHKAESELVAASKLDPKNPKIRLMLVEFYIEMKMNKRAEGELKRFLEIAPDNKDALKLLAGLQV
ncbi:MAG: DnaJ domain-containing protein [Blastocatellia bacterium]